mmetsp:Transcript_92337/g.246996  ORF Transcript_92337/g.246996 Transcript_92337/m.246996 type:complete len:262 (+) Transcript_92337:1226-2011(+)
MDVRQSAIWVGNAPTKPPKKLANPKATNSLVVDRVYPAFTAYFLDVAKDAMKIHTAMETALGRCCVTAARLNRSAGAWNAGSPAGMGPRIGMARSTGSTATINRPIATTTSSFTSATCLTTLGTPGAFFDRFSSSSTASIIIDVATVIPRCRSHRHPQSKEARVCRVGTLPPVMFSFWDRAMTAAEPVMNPDSTTRDRKRTKNPRCSSPIRSSTAPTITEISAATLPRSASSSMSLTASPDRSATRAPVPMDPCMHVPNRK